MPSITPTSSTSGSYYFAVTPSTLSGSYPSSGTIPNVYGNQVSTPQTNPYVYSPAPTEGMVANIQDKLYRYSEALNQWIEVVDANPAEIAEAPKIKVELDAREMLAALQEYKTFLEDLDGLENSTGEIVDDVVFGLREAIEALEKLRKPNG